MASSSRALALWCAVVVVVVCTRAAAYTVDCNHEYTDCDTELSKLANEEEDVPSSAIPASISNTEVPSTTTIAIITPTRSTQNIKEIDTEKTTEMTVVTDTTDIVESSAKPKPRLLNLNVDELQNFANALHNQTIQTEPKKSLVDLSDVNLDGEDEEEPSKLSNSDAKHKGISDKFYSNLQAPFHPLLGVDKGSEEIEICRENGISYKIGEHIDRGCEEVCECTSRGTFDCSPRCKHPYIRQGRRLNDPLCFESPVDECCSIIACSTGNGEKPTTVEVCRYGNDTHPVGAKWNIGCEQTCTCEKNSIVTCKPRCTRPPQSDKCINVQDPKDECCEVQICDVSQDVHEEPMENITSSTTTSTTEHTPKNLEEIISAHKSHSRPLVLAEPIGSIKVLHNNSVQVNLIHMNTSDDPIHLLLSDDGGQSYKDIQLRYSNLILNLDSGKDYILKTKETGTKFNFTITTSETEVNEVLEDDSGNSTKVGCYQDGQFYEIGEEFHIGCTELCECTGHDTSECAPLVCPNHVGLELVSKGCVRWAPTPPTQPPNCCPRSARCLSDGTCHYKGVAIPNWSEVPLSLTGCEEHCFCENGELDCQAACSPLPPLPPQNFRCPPMHRPAPVNISDEDCCKQWGCIPHAEETQGSSYPKYSMPTLGEEPIVNYVTPIAPILPTFTTSVLPIPPVVTDKYKYVNHVKTSFPKILKTFTPVSGTIPNIQINNMESQPKTIMADNITDITPEDIDSPFKTIFPESVMKSNENWDLDTQHRTPVHVQSNMHTYKNAQSDIITLTSDLHSKRPLNIILSDSKMQDALHQTLGNQPLQSNSLSPHDMFVKQMHENVKKVPLSQVDNLHHFLPIYDKKLNSKVPFKLSEKVLEIPQISQKLFEPYHNNHSFNYLSFKPPVSVSSKHDSHDIVNDLNRKHVTVLRHKDIKAAKQDEHPNSALWAQQDIKTHLFTKSNPYETVLLHALPIRKPETMKASKTSSKTYSPLELEHLLSQMEMKSEVNRNLGRSAEKTHGQLPPGFPPNAPRPPPPFLPTVPPGNRYPQEDIPDYDQNNIHRPGNPLDPALAGLPPGLPIPTNYGEENKKLTVISLQSDSPTSVKMLFGLPSVLVGLRGSVDLRFTDSADEDVSHWHSQVFAPADEVLTTPRLEFRLTGLKPSTTYKIRGKLYLNNLPVEPESDVYSIRTQDLPTLPPVEEKRREIDSKLTVVDVNDTTAHVSWRHFTEEELQFIDGIQVRYRPMGTPIYSMTELLHHSRSTAELQELRPGSRYEASLVLIPPPRANTELLDPAKVEFTTAAYIDPYNWSVVVEARSVGSEAAELEWRGVPSPAERWVRVYRAAHACGDSRKEHDAFRLAARDSPPAITLNGLEPDAKCRVWLELFLTNGKIKTSNVLEIHTKSQDSPEPIDNVIEASSVSGSRGAARGDYYGALVVVGVVAALAALAAVLLLLVVVRRHRPRSVPITPVPSAPRDSSLPPYDNPAYKLELQQETMDL